MHSRNDHHNMSCILRVGALDSETSQHTNKRLQINIKPSEPRLQINDKIDQCENGKKKITGICQKRVQFDEFFPENFVCLPFSFSTLGPNASEKRLIESAETGQNDKPIIEVLSLRTVTQLKDNYLC